MRKMVTYTETWGDSEWPPTVSYVLDCVCVCDHLSDFLMENLSSHLPDDLEETVRRVVTPRVVLPGTESTSIQKETQDMTTIRIVGK